MSVNADIIRQIRLIAETDIDLYPIVCTVKSVDLTALTAYCVPIDTDYPDIIDSSLMIDNQVGFLVIPSINSQVLVQPMFGGGSYVAMFSSVQSIQLDGSDYGGLVKVQELTDKINALENLLNELIGNYNGHTHIGTYAVSGSSATGTSNPTLSQETSTISPITTTASICSTYVSHGSGQ